MTMVDLSLAFVTGHPRAMALLDAEGRVVVHSRGWIRQEGPIPDLVGTPVVKGEHLLGALERSSHPDAAAVDRMIREVLSEGQPTVQAEIRARCGADHDRSVVVVTAMRVDGRRAVCLEFLPTTPPRRAGIPESETPFREVVETLESVVFVTSPGIAGAQRVIHYVSPAYERVWGRPRSLLRDEPTSFLESVHPDDRDGVAANLWRESQGSWDREFRIVRPGGGLRWIHSRAFPVRNGKGDVDRVVTLATDVTPRHEVTEALRRSRDELDQMVDRAPVALILHQRGQVLKANRVAARYLGEDHPASVTRIDLMDRIHPEDRALSDPIDGTGPRPADRVIRLRATEGEWVGYRAASTRVTHGSGEPVSLLALWGPHTPASPAPDATSSEVADFFDAAPLGTVLIDADGRAVRANAYWTGLVGWNEHAPSGAPLWALLPDDEQRRARAALRALHTGRISAVHAEVDLSHGAGHRIPVGLHASVVGEPGGQARVLVLAEDLTGRRAAMERARQVDRFRSLSRLAGGIAHDFNNLMTVVTGHAELVLDELPHDSHTAVDVREIRAAGLRAASLTDELLTYSRRRPGEPVALDLGRLLRQMEPELRETVGSEIDVVLDVAPGTARVEADAGQLERLVDQLAANARDAMPDGGRLALSVRQRDDDWVQLSVTDTGEGIPGDVVDHIFEPFFSTRPPSHASGLGLALVHGIVEERGGRIEVRSDVGEGTTFSVLLPKAQTDHATDDEPADPPTPSAASDEQAEGSGTDPQPADQPADVQAQVPDDDATHSAEMSGSDAQGAGSTAVTAPGPSSAIAADVPTFVDVAADAPPPDLVESPWTMGSAESATLLPADVLFVDGEDSVLRLGIRLLEREGFRVHGASTGAEAITRLSTRSSLPDLVVSDARLRDLDVDTFVSAVRTVSPTLPVLLLSAFDPHDDRVPRGPALSMLQKPFNGEELLISVRRALRRRRND